MRGHPPRLVPNDAPDPGFGVVCDQTAGSELRHTRWRSAEAVRSAPLLVTNACVQPPAGRPRHTSTCCRARPTHVGHISRTRGVPDKSGGGRAGDGGAPRNEAAPAVERRLSAARGSGSRTRRRRPRAAPKAIRDASLGALDLTSAGRVVSRLVASAPRTSTGVEVRRSPRALDRRGGGSGREASASWGRTGPCLDRSPCPARRRAASRWRRRASSTSRTTRRPCARWRAPSSGRGCCRSTRSTCWPAPTWCRSTPGWGPTTPTC